MIKQNRISGTLFFLLLFGASFAFAQFPPAAGQPGSTAIHKDSSIFVEWASGCNLTRGLQDISNAGLGFVTVGDSSMACGMAGTNGVVSLGDGGSAALTFDHPIVNGPSWDFAVFENSFDDWFLELAYVEVSSNGKDFFVFPSASLTDTNVQIGAFDSLDARKINNMAGKYRGLYGTPFDLEELKYEAGLDVNHITHVKVVDVVGSLLPQYARRDSAGRKINDPWPTAFASGGFDLDAVGAIWNTANSIHENKSEVEKISIYPNPAKDIIQVFADIADHTSSIITIFDTEGGLISESGTDFINHKISADVSKLRPGLYFIRVRTAGLSTFTKLIKI